MAKISVLGGFSSELEVDECPGNSSLKSVEQTEKNEETSSSLTAPKTEKSYRKPKKDSTASSAEESTK